MKPAGRLVLAVPALLWLACETSTEPQAQPAPEPEPQAGLFTYAYTHEGDQLSLQVDTVYCVDTALVRDTFLVTAYTRLTVDSLILTFNDTLRLSGAVVRTVRRCVRMDTGAALQGRWRVTSDERSVLAGSPTSSEAAALARDSIIADSMIAQQGYVVTFTASWMAGTFQGSLARVMLPWVSAGIPAECRVTVALTASTVQFTGALSGEVVTVTIDEHLNRRYTSSRASRVPYTVWERPEYCVQQIPWFADFVSDNMPFADEFMQSETVTFVVEVGAVEATRVDDSTVRLTGRVTGEVVTVSCDSLGAVTFTSTQTGHDTWTIVRRSGQIPVWWEQFIQDNLLP